MWLLAVVLVPVLLTAVFIAVRTGPTENDLRQRSLAALADRGITGVQVEFSGRDATVVVPAGADADQAREVVAAVDGVRAARTAGGEQQAPVGDRSTSTGTTTSTEAPPSVSPSGSPSESAPAARTVAPFTLSRTDASLSVQAVVPDQAAKDQLLVDARTLLDDGSKLDEQVSVDAATGVPNPLALSGLLQALSTATGEATVTYDGTTVTLTGRVADQATKATAARSAATAVPGAVVANQLRVPQIKRPPVSEACQTFESRLTQFMTRNRIGFLSGTSLLTEASRVSVVRVAPLLTSCDTVRVEVGGHTDNSGDPDTSQPLSQRRAVAVKAELIRLGVPAGRITARGYGESRPFAPNTTPAGRIANRRVEIKVV